MKEYNNVRVPSEAYQLLHKLQERARMRTYQALPEELASRTAPTLGGLMHAALQLLSKKMDEDDGIDVIREAMAKAEEEKT